MLALFGGLECSVRSTGLVQAVPEPTPTAELQTACVCKIQQEHVVGFSSSNSTAAIAPVTVTESNIFHESFAGVTTYPSDGQVAKQASTITCKGICKSVEIMTTSGNPGDCSSTSTMELVQERTATVQYSGTFDATTLPTAGDFCGLKIQALKTTENPGPSHCHQLRTCEPLPSAL